MMTTLTATNEFHGSEATIQAEIFENNYGLVAIVNADDLDRVAAHNCGIAGCCCNSVGHLHDDAGNTYHVTVR